VRGAEAGTVSLEYTQGPTGHRLYCRKREEYLADFTLVTQRALDEFEYKLFRYTFLLGADWRLCTRFLDMDRGTYFHHVYRIEQKLGRCYADLEPYALYPVDEYFGGGRVQKRIPAYRQRRIRKPPVRVPMMTAVLIPNKLTA
jgi:hypothetical protein